ncbi:MAG: histidinol-phosphate transaminase [Spirochaetota bacterium]
MKYWNTILKSMTEYIPGEQPEDIDEYIKLNTNENPFPPSGSALEAIKNACNGTLRLYPSPASDKLIKTFATLHNLSHEQVFAANGSDELFTLFFRCFIDRNQKAAFSYPSYSLYYTMCEANGITYDKITLNDDFSVRYDAFLQDDYALVIFCNPNNPTATSIDRNGLIRFLDSFTGVVIVDEAYVDFSNNTVIDLVNRYDNLIVTRSFSKSYSLAGLRVGIAAAHPDLIRGLLRMKDSYNVDRLACVGAAAALTDTRQLEYNTRMVINNRDYLAENLTALGFQNVPSSANFIFTRHPKLPSETLYTELKQRKILVRHFKGEIQSEYIRISVGTMMEMKRLIKTIREIFSLHNIQLPDEQSV